MAGEHRCRVKCWRPPTRPFAGIPLPKLTHNYRELPREPGQGLSAQGPKHSSATCLRNSPCTYPGAHLPKALGTAPVPASLLMCCPAGWPKQPACDG